jgi:SAM-dependent methyltransferase
MESSEYFQIERVEETHFWYRAMEKLALDTIQQSFPTGCGRILDVGCGPGGMTQKLTRFGPTAGIDIHPTAHTIAHSRVALLVMGDTCSLPFATNQFDLVTVFDVLYNQAVSDDLQALQEIFRVLKPGGQLYVREPALEGLRGDHDIVVKTRHRYTRKELARKMNEAGFTIQRSTYANMTLSIPIFLKRGMQRLTGSKNVTSDTQALPKLLNQLFYNILRFENKLLRAIKLPFGSSVICIASKTDHSTLSGFNL